MSLTWFSHSVSSPAWTNVGASCQPSRMPWSSSQSLSSSSASDVSSGLSFGALETFSTARICRSMMDSRLARSNLPAAIIRSLPRIPETRSRRLAVARTAAAAGLLSSWVRPAVSEPSASSRSRWPTASRVR